MNAPSFTARRDMLVSGALVLTTTAVLFAWSPSLRPDFLTAPMPPPTITYYAQSPDARAKSNRDPALIALSTAMMLPQARHGQADTVTPPLKTEARFLSFTDRPAQKPIEHLSMLTMRPMSTPALQRLAPHLSTPDSNVIWTRRPSVLPRAYHVDFTGNRQGRSIDLKPVLALDEPSVAWSFTAVLLYDENGRVQHVLLESAELDPPLRNQIAQHLYQCRITPPGKSGEDRLTVFGPGRASHP